MQNKKCCMCGKENLSRNEIGLTKKLLDEKAKQFYCFDCLVQYLEIDMEFLLLKLEEFKRGGCKFF
jgi:hypothetical protein